MRGKEANATPLHEIQASLFAEPMGYNGEPYPTFLWGSTGVHDLSEQMMAGTRVLNVNAADALDLTRAEVEARYQLRWVLDKLRSTPGWENAYLIDVGAQIGVRVGFSGERSRETLILRGGEGVGRVTKPGLPVAVGEPAINPAYAYINVFSKDR